MHQTMELEQSPRLADQLEPKPGPGLLKIARSWVVSAAITGLLALGLRTFVVETYVIPSASMVPTLQVDDHVIVEKTPLDLNGVHVGDVIVFDRPASLAPSGPDNLIKRVVAVGGDTVEAHGGVVWLNGAPVDEPYLSAPTSAFSPVVVPDGTLFVLGDNRGDSTDSRVFGPIDLSSVIGSAFGRVWPITRIGPLG